MECEKKAQLLSLPKYYDPRGNLSVIESGSEVPFTIRRTYWIYDVPGGVNRNGHAFRHQEEFIVALSGSFDVIIHDGSQEHSFHLDRSYMGLYVPAKTWRRMVNFATNSVALVVSSTAYDELDYIEDFNEFLQSVKK